ncbi:MAG: FG-GAP repeat domain-containing protein [Gemmataceae bacterium]
MRWRLLAGGVLSLPILAVLFVQAGAETGVAADKTSWKKTVVDKAFRSEGVAIADVNKDGKMDILVGDVWYEAPDWKIHEIRPSPKEGYDPKNYSKSFCCWAEDLNGDGYPDLLVVPFPGEPMYWYENPKGKDGHWKQHLLWHSSCNETPQYIDLLGTGKRVLIMGFQPKDKDPNGNLGQMAYFTPGADPTTPWDMHPISEPSPDDKHPVPGTFRFSHGLGVGDVNGDGKLDVICTGGWWEQPAKGDGKPWKFHPADLGPDCSDIYAYDMDGDGKADIISSSAHKFGIWWHQQKPGNDGPTFVLHDLFKDLVSETHALHFVDINGDGLKDLVTGKRWWSHGTSEPGSNKPAMLYWFEAQKGKDGITKFVPHEIDNDSGVGTQFVVDDFNGDKLLDVIVSNKKGTFIFEHQRK